MAGINTRGVVVGGLVAGLIINISEFILNVPVLGAQMEAVLAERGLPPVTGGAVAIFVTFGFVLGFLLIWLYAAIRPRFGPGPRTAVIAGLTVWFLAYFFGSLGYGVLGLFPWGLLSVAMLWGLVELLIAALAGARIYSEGV